jgi:predicted esterase
VDRLKRKNLAILCASTRLLGLVLAALIVLVAAPRAHAEAAGSGASPDPLRLKVPGHADAFYYRAHGKGTKPVLMYLHGRGGNPFEDCRKWARVATEFGWVVCPQGPEDRGGGARAWDNNPAAGKEITDLVLSELRRKYKGRVSRTNNILIGFSEGAFVAMQLGLHDPGTWGRWLILAANDQYWFGDTESELTKNHRLYRRVFLLTGESDGVAANTKRVADILKKAKVPVKLRIAKGMGHEIPGERMVSTYRRPLLWLAAAK